MMLAAVAGALLATMAMALARALMGPTLYDRILAMNMFATNTVLIVAVLGYLNGRPDFLDIALLYALVNFVGVLALLRFFQLSRYGARRTRRVSPW